MSPSRRRFVAASAAMAFAPWHASAQTGATAAGPAYPTRALRIVVPYSAGGASDAPMRVIAQELAAQLGQGVVVDNKPGQGGMIGSELVARAAPDGYTLLLASNPQTISANLYGKLGFDPVEDFAPVSLFGREPSVLVVHPSLPVHTVAQFIAYVKARPGKLDYASSGNGSAQHLFTAMFLSAAGLKMVHVPYRGSAPAVQDVIGGQVPVAMPGIGSMLPHIREQRLRALAVTAATRSPLLADVPTLAESGFPGFSAYVWSGLAAPKGTPPAVLERLHRELETALATPAVKSFMDQAAMEPVMTTPAQMQAFMRREKERAGKVIREAGVHVD
jgi:tripartite-type tricarboxylate transporter receptor subunit TctC